MKIGEFALLNGVTTKMLRNYDEIGLLQPESVDPFTGYRLYAEHQARYLSWVLLLKELDFSLAEIKDILRQPNDTQALLRRLQMKRIDISDRLNVQLSKSMQITRLIRIIEKEGFQLDQKIDLLSISDRDILSIMKSIPNTGAFIERVGDMLSGAEDRNTETGLFIRTDLDHFKHINDTYGFEVGDRIIALNYTQLESAVRAAFSSYAIARSHGDEFIVFAFGDRKDAEAFARHYYESAGSPDLAALELPECCGCSIGIVLLKKLGQWRHAFDYALEALRMAKNKGGNAYEILEYTE